MDSFEGRCRKSAELAKTYPDHLPVLIRPAEGAPPLDRERYLIPKDLTCAEMCHVVRKHVGVGLRKDQALFLMTHNVVLTGSRSVRGVHQEFGAPDGFLYVTYCLEHAFGSQASQSTSVF